MLHCAAGVLAFTALMAFGARISVPMVPVPMTLQSWAVLLAGAALGARAGALSATLYLLLGALGLPVLAQGAHGLAPFRGASAGFLFAFPLIAALAGRCAPTLRHGPLPRALTCAAALHLALLAMGTAWLITRVGWSRGWSYGFMPFVPGALLKSAGVVAALRGASTCKRSTRG